MKTRVMVVDDEQDIRDILVYILENAGYEVEAYGRGDVVLEACSKWRPAIVILDIGLPGMNGLEVCRLLFQEGIPVLVLSSHDHDDQIIKGLEVGAEDYVAKPFNFKELLLRIEKIVRRTSGYPTPQKETVEVGNLVIDVGQQLLFMDGKEVRVTPTEFKIMEILALNLHAPVSTEALLRDVWNSTDWINGAEMVKVNIWRLRKKLEKEPSCPVLIRNKRGFGYHLSDISGSVDT